MKKELQERYSLIKDRHAIAGKLGIPNIDLYFRDSILNNPDEVGAESLLEHLEEVDRSIHEDLSLSILEGLRQKRDRILCATDWLFVSDVTIDKKHRKMYLEYRTYLRNRPEHIRTASEVFIEPFDNYVRRNHPEEFLDGGKGKQIIAKFNYYL